MSVSELRYRFAEPSHHAELEVLRDSNSGAVKATVDNLGAVARGYAWAHADMPGYVAPTHGGDALDFALAYAIHAADARGHKPVRDAYAQWFEKGRISREY